MTKQPILLSFSQKKSQKKEYKNKVKVKYE